MFNQAQSRLATDIDGNPRQNVVGHDRYFSAYSREKIDGYETTDRFVFMLPAGANLDRRLICIQIEERNEELADDISDEDLIDVINGLDWDGEPGFSDLDSGAGFTLPVQICKEITKEQHDVYLTIF